LSVQLLIDHGGPNSASVSLQNGGTTAVSGPTSVDSGREPTVTKNSRDVCQTFGGVRAWAFVMSSGAALWIVVLQL
jgi:hypothetical protein